jgi:hypothetical protein
MLELFKVSLTTVLYYKKRHYKHFLLFLLDISQSTFMFLVLVLLLRYDSNNDVTILWIILLANVMENLLTVSNICTTIYVQAKIYINTRKAQRFRKKKELSSFIAVMDRAVMRRYINHLIAKGEEAIEEEDEDGKSKYLMKKRERELERLGEKQTVQAIRETNLGKVLETVKRANPFSKKEDKSANLFGDATVHPDGGLVDDSKALRYHDDTKPSNYPALIKKNRKILTKLANKNQILLKPTTFDMNISQTTNHGAELQRVAADHDNLDSSIATNNLFQNEDFLFTPLEQNETGSTEQLGKTNVNEDFIERTAGKSNLNDKEQGEARQAKLKMIKDTFSKTRNPDRGKI